MASSQTRSRDRVQHTLRFEDLESRQLLSATTLVTATTLEQGYPTAPLYGPFLPDAKPVPQPAAANNAAANSAPVAAPADAPNDMMPTVTVDPYVMVAQGFANADGSNPAPQDGRYFKGFPSMEVLPSGRIISVFAAGSAHGSDDRQARWTYSDDGGATWSTPVTLSIICNGVPTTTLVPESIYRIPSGPNQGRLLLSFWNEAQADKSRIAWSDDNGQTWSASVPASDPNPNFTSYHFGGHPIQLADGSLLTSGYAHVNSQTYYIATTMRSTDGGQTWSPWSTITSGQGVSTGEQPEEPCLLLMDNGQILCTVREDTSASVRTYINTDGTGSNWTLIAGPPFGAFRGFGRPSLVQDSNGAIICITRDAFTTYPVFFVSRDHGATWGPGQALSPDARYFVYGDMRSMGNGKIALVYGAQAIDTYVRSDVRFTYLNDVLSGNVAPVLGIIPDQTVAVNEPLTFTAQATDANLDGITFSLGAGAPPGATIDPTTGVFNWNGAGAIGSKTKLTVIATENTPSHLSDSKTLTISLVSGAPIASVTGPSASFRGATASFSFSASDSAADVAAGFTYLINWGDGTPVQTIKTGSSSSVPHSFDVIGQVTVSVTAVDQHGNTSTPATQTMQVAAVKIQPNANNANLTDVVWYGTSGQDQVRLDQMGDGVVRITELMLNGVAVSNVQTYTGITGRPIINGQAGDDVLDARGMQTMPVTLNGNFGNNTLYGGDGGDLLIGGSNGAEGDQGNNVIIAGNGNNTIYGNDLLSNKNYNGGNNLIVGGSGHDTIYGNYGANKTTNGGEGGQNLIIGGGGADTIYASQIVDGAEGGHGSILVSGSTTLSQTALLSILGEWTSTRTYAQRVANIQGTGTGDRLNGNNFLQAGATVNSDGARDDVFSDTNGALNWLLVTNLQDPANRVKPTEQVTFLP